MFLVFGHRPELAAENHMEGPLNRRERRPQLVSGHGDELRFLFVQFLEPLVGDGQFLAPGLELSQFFCQFLIDIFQKAQLHRLIGRRDAGERTMSGRRAPREERADESQTEKDDEEPADRRREAREIGQNKTADDNHHQKQIIPSGERTTHRGLIISFRRHSVAAAAMVTDGQAVGGVI